TGVQTCALPISGAELDTVALPRGAGPVDGWRRRRRDTRGGWQRARDCERGLGAWCLRALAVRHTKRGLESGGKRTLGRRRWLTLGVGPHRRNCNGRELDRRLD